MSKKISYLVRTQLFVTHEDSKGSHLLQFCALLLKCITPKENGKCWLFRFVDGGTSPAIEYSQIEDFPTRCNGLFQKFVIDLESKSVRNIFLV